MKLEIGDTLIRKNYSQETLVKVSRVTEKRAFVGEQALEREYNESPTGFMLLLKAFGTGQWNTVYFYLASNYPGLGRVPFDFFFNLSARHVHSIVLRAVVVKNEGDKAQCPDNSYYFHKRSKIIKMNIKTITQKRNRPIIKKANQSSPFHHGG